MIEVKNLCYAYANNDKAVDNINFSISDGEIVGIIGKTGSGKSTLVKMLSGLLLPTHGEIKLDGKNINKDFEDMRDVHFKVGLVMQYPENQLFGKNIFEDIVFATKNQGINDKNKLQKIAETAVKSVGLDNSVLNRSFLNLSGGEKRKCAIASVISIEPEVLILDEPTCGLDQKSTYELISSIKKYHKEKNKIIIIISHVMEEIAQLCDKVLVMNTGKQIYYDKPANVFAHCENLRKIGLDTPQTSKIISLLNDQGYDFDKSIITPKQAVDKILELLKSGDA